jgi:O-antigen/teichoic acid export membrane protein
MSERNLAKNTAFYSAALAGQKVLSFIYFIFLARAIGVDNQGRFSFALSFAAIFAMFLDLGLTQILIRETAKNKEKSENQLANVIGFKLLASIVIYALIVVLVNLMGYPELTRQLVYISGFVMLLDSLSLSVYGVIRGHHNLFFESLGTIVNQMVILIFGLLGLWLGWSLQMLMGVYLLGSLVNFIWSAYNLNVRFGLKILARFNWLVIYDLLKISIPFAIAGIFNRIFSSIDIVLLSKLAGDWSVGIYSVAFKAVFALQFLALAFSASLYPAFSNYFAHSKENLAKLFTKSMYWLILTSLPLAAGTIAIADKAVGVVFGEAYLPSVAPLQILMTSMIFVFLCFPIGALLNACDRQSRNTFNMGIVAAFSFISNLILIPIWGYNGSAVANLLSYLLLFILGIIAVEQVTNYDKILLIKSFGKALLACVVMFLAVFLLKDFFHFIIVIPIGALIYLFFAYIFGLFSIKSIKDFAGEFIK